MLKGSNSFIFSVVIFILLLASYHFYSILYMMDVSNGFITSLVNMIFCLLVAIIILLGGILDRLER